MKDTQFERYWRNPENWDYTDDHIEDWDRPSSRLIGWAVTMAAGAVFWAFVIWLL